MSSDDIAAIKDLIRQSDARNWNEASTRHQIIDLILHDHWKWPRMRVGTEEYIAPGFADYVLKRPNGEDLLFIEAKREGVYFNLPTAFHDNENFCYLTISKLLSDPNISAAMAQVRNYCFDTGCEFACITNGHEWIFFKTFEKGKKWEKMSAFVIRRLDFFVEDFTRSYNSFSFTAITEKLSLASTLTNAVHADRPLYHPKEKINSYAYSISANRLAATLRPIVNHYFGVISDDDSEFMDKCYVSQRDYHQSSVGMRSLIQDALTPYFEDYGIQQLDDTGKGGRLGGRITKNIKHGRRNEVLVLFGGKGSGKSTFIKRLLFHKPPRWLQDHATIAIVDMLNVPEDKRVIRSHLWTQLIANIDQDGILAQSRDRLIELFADKYKIAKDQELFGLEPQTETYNIKLNNSIKGWKSDHSYCAQRLVQYWNEKGRGIVVVIDNTDQYSPIMQDFCFSSAQEISATLQCMTIISMREERFFNSKIHGLLDAFQNSGFHISSPKPAQVFRRRLEYTISLLSSERKRKLRFGEIDTSIANACCRYLGIILREFGSEKSPLGSFLTACAHGDTRLSLDLFRSFVLSGYTNVDEMLASGHWNFQIHQVIKPVMIPNRYFYDETLSNIPNIFQIRNSRNGSHFTALRVLRRLSKKTNAANPAFMSVAELLAYFVETFGMAEDFVENLDLLLQHGFVEASNRLDEYTDSVDSIKITNYGMYMLTQLFCDLTYLDLVSIDCSLFSELTAQTVVEAARREFNLFIKRDRLDRVKVRLDRIQDFIVYLNDEEMRERETFSLGMPIDEMFTARIVQVYEAERPRVVESASRQRYKNDHHRPQEI